MKSKNLSVSLCYVIPFAALIGLSLPRFNQPYTIFDGPQVTFEKNSDILSYREMTFYFRDGGVATRYEAPFSYRPLAPFVASLMPFDIESSFSLTNVLFLCFALFFTLHVLHISFPDSKPCFPALVGGCMFSLSFPVLWYTTSGWIDAVTLCFLSAGFYFLLRNRMFLFTMTILTGVFANEKTLILLPLVLTHWWIRQELRARLSSPLVILSALLLTTCLVGTRFILPGVDATYWWNLNLDWTLYNATRLRTYASAILTLGIPGLLSLFWLWRSRFRIEKEFMLPVAGIVTVLLLYLFSFLTASASGRFLWLAYPFLVVTAMKYISEWSAERSQRNIF